MREEKLLNYFCKISKVKPNLTKMLQTKKKKTSGNITMVVMQKKIPIIVNVGNYPEAY